MDRSEWLNKLEALHVSSRAGKPVSAEDRTWYWAARTSLLQAAVEVQALSLAGDDRRRGSVRLNRAAQVLLEARGWSVQTLTVDLGAGGFAVLLETPPPVDEWIRAKLLLHGQEPLVTTVSVADTRASGGLFRVAFRYTEPSPATQEAIEASMVDWILEQLVFWDDVLQRLHG
jgi:hypothetical protein